MKNILKIVAILCCLFTVNDTFAQKLGHINSVEILNSMSEWKAAEKQLQTYVKKLEQRIKSKEDVLVTEIKTIQEKIDKGLLTGQQIQQKQKDIEGKQVTLEKERRSAQNDVRKKELELTKPIETKVMNAIKSVAKSQGYTYIFDYSIGTILYANTSNDVTASVKAKLGM